MIVEGLSLKVVALSISKKTIIPLFLWKLTACIMKKAFLLLVAIASVLQAFAQEKKDSLQNTTTAVPFDSLSVRLDRLQHDYDFLFCDYQLHKLIMDLKDLAHTIGNSSNGVVIKVYTNSGYNRNLYNAYLNDYESDNYLFNSLKESAEVLRKMVFVKLLTMDFSDTEREVLASSLNVADKAITAVENSLNYYNVAIEAYRDMR